jgi:hypothetical protein
MDHQLSQPHEREHRWSDADPDHRPLIVTNPVDDRAFRALIDVALRSGEMAPGDLEQVLRTRYPRAVVRPRELAGERAEIWYVYREGHWIRSQDR